MLRDFSSKFAPEPSVHWTCNGIVNNRRSDRRLSSPMEMLCRGGVEAVRVYDKEHWRGNHFWNSLNASGNLGQAIAPCYLLGTGLLARLLCPALFYSAADSAFVSNPGGRAQAI